FKYLLITTDIEGNFMDKRDEFDSLFFVYVEKNSPMKFISGIKYKQLVQEVIISGYDSLTSFDVFENFINLRSLKIFGSRQLQNRLGIKLLENLRFLEISRNWQLNNLQEIPKLQDLDSLVISYNSQLQSLQGMEKLQNLR